MIKIGMIIGDRYEVLEKIGTGGMSDVYKARDNKLNRNVAIKVLKAEFAENESFVSKFRAEAQAAAGLMHPNVVNVYDVGEEGDINYIVMELVEGITLKKYIEKKARLTYKEAVSIAIQVSLGIEAAHNNHIIHRDIKPQNIIISMEGKVKVTDFGIAKAATSNTITSNVMGSVHYTSPEQARGGYSDEKSDIYSLGVSLFEMLTGRVPFNGETTVAIAIKHIQEEMPSPREFVAEIPASVEAIVLKCCEKSPDRRYQNMQSLIVDLKQSLRSPDADFVVRSDAIMEGETQLRTDEDIQEIRAQSRERGYYQDSQMQSQTAPQQPYTARLAQLPEDYGPDEEGYGEEDTETYYESKIEKVTTILAILAGIIIIVFILVLASKFFSSHKPTSGSGNKTGNELVSPIITDDEPTSDQNAPVSEGEGATDTATEISTVTMPNVIDEEYDRVETALRKLGLVTEIEYQESDTVAEGKVISASVASGTTISTGTTVKLYVSSGTAGIDMPNVIGNTYEDAYTILKQAGFTVNKTESNSSEVEAGRVISQNPESGTKVPSGSVVTVSVSIGPEAVKVRVPSFIGLSEEDARILIAETGLTLGHITYVASDSQEVGNVCKQSISVGSYVDPETTIDIDVSTGVGGVSYKYTASITCPTAEEAPYYVSGTMVKVVLTTDDGQVLLETTTDTFPIPANYFGLTCSEGTITMLFVGKNDAGENQEYTFTRKVTFSQE